MDSAKVKSRNRQIRRKVDTNTGCIRIRGRVRLLEPAFITNGNQMIRIDGFDVSGYLGCPVVDSGAISITINDAGSIGTSTPWFVGELPSHDGRFVTITCDPSGNIFLICSDNVSVRVKVVMRGLA